jgi:hypothetical protein
LPMRNRPAGTIAFSGETSPPRRRPTGPTLGGAAEPRDAPTRLGGGSPSSGIVVRYNVHGRRCVSVHELKVELPESLSEEEAKILLAVKSFEVGKLTLGQAAKMGSSPSEPSSRPWAVTRFPSSTTQPKSYCASLSFDRGAGRGDCSDLLTPLLRARLKGRLARNLLDTPDHDRDGPVPGAPRPSYRLLDFLLYFAG